MNLDSNKFLKGFFVVTLEGIFNFDDKERKKVLTSLQRRMTTYLSPLLMGRLLTWERYALRLNKKLSLIYVKNLVMLLLGHMKTFLALDLTRFTSRQQDFTTPRGSYCS